MATSGADYEPLLVVKYQSSEYPDGGSKSRSPSPPPQERRMPGQQQGLKQKAYYLCRFITSTRQGHFLLFSVLILLSFSLWWMGTLSLEGPSSGSSSKDPLFHILPHLRTLPVTVTAAVDKPPLSLSLSLPEKDPSFYIQNCFRGNSLIDIDNIYNKLLLLKGSESAECSRIWRLFDSILSVEYIRASEIKFPVEFKAQVRKWLGGSDALMEEIRRQDVYKFGLRGLGEETAFNPLRAKRPQSRKEKENPLDYVNKLSEETKETCDFCKYKEHTAEDSFGRIESIYSASSSNTFKLAKYHGLFFPIGGRHHPLNISLPVIRDLFLNTSLQWFKRALKDEEDIGIGPSPSPSSKYPTLLWDLLPHGGASQVHPHIHGMLGDSNYAGAFGGLYNIQKKYEEEKGRSLLSDILEVHWALGLGIRRGRAVAILPLFARKDNEVLILSEDVNDDFVNLIFSVFSMYKDELKLYCFSSGGAYPTLQVHGGNDMGLSRGGLPAIWRFGSRGSCTSISSDVSSLELYTIYNINSDLEQTFSALQKSVMTTAATIQQEKSTNPVKDRS